MQLGTKQISVHPFLESHYSQLPNGGSNPFINRRINKRCHIHTIEYYSAFKENEVLTHATIWMNPESIIY